MPRIVLATFGSLGDLHPAIALALALRARGHAVTLATSEPYRAKIAALGLPFRAMLPDVSPIDEAMVRRIMDGSRGSEYLMRELVFPAVRAMHADLAAIAADADLLVTSELVCAAPLLGEISGRPWAFFSLSPISFFPIFDPPLLPGPPGTHFLQALGPTANRLLFNAAKLVTHSWWAPVRQFRRELGLPPGRSPIFEGKFSPHLNLALFSPILQVPQPDWPAPTVQTGFLFHDETESNPRLPAAVESFLATGEPPIVFTLGSAAVSLARDFYAGSARAAQQLGRRALLLIGKNAPPSNLPPSVLAWDYLPYAQVFPRAAAIVHQGGIGTTAQALRAGRPMVIVPFAHDQFDNAARITRLGAARTLSRSRYCSDSIAKTLDLLLTSPGVAAAAALGTRLRAERGLERACDALEHTLNA
jgi:UDP:flavonoid glycosyltransferase YjiC (YdhE family)